MNTYVDKYFSNANSVDEIPEKIYSKLTPLLDAVAALSQSTNKCVYVIDYLKKNFMFVSPNVDTILGISSEDMLSMGYKYHIEHVPKEDREMILELNKKGFEFFDQTPLEKRKKLSMFYDFHIINKDGNMIMVHHTLTSLLLTKKGRIWLAFCTMTLSSATESGNIYLQQEGSDIFHEYNLTTHNWRQCKRPKLNTTEYALLSMTIQGYSIEEISQSRNIPINTLKSSKRLLFKKFGVNNISGAITYAQNYRLI